MILRQCLWLSYHRSQRKRAKQSIAPLPQDVTDEATFKLEWKMTIQQEVRPAVAPWSPASAADQRPDVLLCDHCLGARETPI